MDKRVIFAVAGSGKTSHIVDSLSLSKRSLIITYTRNNYANLSEKIAKKFDNSWPSNITLMTYFQFLFSFCYKPFLSDRIRAKGIIYSQNQNRYIPKANPLYYLSNDRYLYSNRISLLLEEENVIEKIKARLSNYFDEFIIDEVQDIAGRDFNLLVHLMEANINMLFVGDFFQHTFDTSRDGNINKTLFDNFDGYKTRFSNKGFSIDTTTLVKSWRCSKQICDFISSNLGIRISSNKPETCSSYVLYVSNPQEIDKILDDASIIKLHYDKSYKYGPYHKNWGITKGEDCYNDICVMLNKKTLKLYEKGLLDNLPPSTRNKLYVAITRAHGNVYLIDENH